MPTSIAREAELRRNVIDRLIAASLDDTAPAREAKIEGWRSLKTHRNEGSGKADPNAA